MSDREAAYNLYDLDITCLVPEGDKVIAGQRLMNIAVLMADNPVISATRSNVIGIGTPKLAEEIALECWNTGGVITGENDKVKAKLGVPFMPHRVGPFLGNDTPNFDGYEKGKD